MKSYTDGILVFPIEILNDYLFYLASATNNKPFRVTPPHLVDNTDTQYLRDQHWQQCWCFRFFFLFVSICLSMCQSLCVSVHLFTVTLKFLNVSLVPGLELKSAACLLKCLGTFLKAMGEVLVTWFVRKQPLQQLKLLLLLWLFVLLYTSWLQWAL